MCSQRWDRNLTHCCPDSTVDELDVEIPVDSNRVREGQCSSDFS